jgi:hypothetical protein
VRYVHRRRSATTMARYDALDNTRRAGVVAQRLIQL